MKHTTIKSLLLIKFDLWNKRAARVIAKLSTNLPHLPSSSVVTAIYNTSYSKEPEHVPLSLHIPPVAVPNRWGDVSKSINRNGRSNFSLPRNTSS